MFFPLADFFAKALAMRVFAAFLAARTRSKFFCATFNTKIEIQAISSWTSRLLAGVSVPLSSVPLNAQRDA